MTRYVFSVLLSLCLMISAATAQERTRWIQLNAYPDLTSAQNAARAFGANVEDVNGFTLGGGWYSVALGPYTPLEAQDRLERLQQQGLIPQDSYVALPDAFLQQFWPVGVNLLSQPPLIVTLPEEEQVQLAQAEPDLTPEAEPAQIEAEEAQPEQAVASRSNDGRPAPHVIEDGDAVFQEETLAEARASEARLTRDQRAELQRMLQWAGFYNSAIDAAFGPGTRNAMSRWQRSNGFNPTGVLTTRQRSELFRQFNGVIEGLDVKLVRDTESGIEIRLPLAAVTFDSYSAPFSKFAPTGEIRDAQVLLISQAGDRSTFVGLYDIMQTLEIVPEEGDRAISGDGFVLRGANDRITSHTQAWLKNGEIKGFTLIWPTGDEERRRRLLNEMQGSFQRIPGVLDPAAGADEGASIDLVSGLDVRRPVLSRSGFFVDNSGTVVTTMEALQGCGRITIDEDYKATVVASDTDLGVAVLRPVDQLAPSTVARFQGVAPSVPSEVAVAGYSYGGVLGAPTMTFGQLQDLRGLNGEGGVKRLAMSTLEGDVGGPVVDRFGAVIGMLLPDQSQGRQLPEDVRFAVDAAALTDLLAQAGVTPGAVSGGTTAIPPVTLSKQTSGMTVLVSCWE